MKKENNKKSIKDVLNEQDKLFEKAFDLMEKSIEDVFSERREKALDNVLKRIMESIKSEHLSMQFYKDGLFIEFKYVVANNSLEVSIFDPSKKIKLVFHEEKNLEKIVKLIDELKRVILEEVGEKIEIIKTLK